ncbi:Carbohydrate esterase family 16 protein [Mycena indigotica]|uniref:Carbohydrate esterase family 16 protein n=1 Tax=Mycena indigotica TaxID=2126181 RepID=A0A8H6WBF1_9AGAR|nr:Carbohydrate esterase family 16 protein [Mycena indigotica]KAF7306309.1 Carbohydrate esterase family 16 protein [Mycena indigotica]
MAPGLLMFLALFSLAGLVAAGFGVGVRKGQIKNLVTFGDSYTDVVNTGDAATAWPVYAAGYAHVQLHPFARAGATCSNNLTFRPFPSIFESQLPLFFSEVANGSLKLPPDNTIYTLWDGTNDLGVSALLTGGAAPKVSLVDVTECQLNWVKTLYEHGARNFIFQNMIPLQLTILYNVNSYPNRYWAFERNTTEWSVFMTELTLTGNKLTELMLQALVPTLHGAHIALFDSHSLFQDMFDHPANYFNGTAPLNVTGAWNACVSPLGGGPLTCTTAQGTDRDSFLWEDELHPSEQADRIVAREIALVLEGKQSRWATWLS